jgi:hypothetical protein
MMTSVGYGWAQPLVRDLCEAERRNIGFCLTADRATQFYILLAIRGWQRRGRLASPFHAFATDIATVSRRQMLQRLWDKDLGTLSVLRNCLGFPWSRNAIDELAEALAVKSLRDALSRQSRVTPKAVKTWLAASPEIRSSDYVELGLRFGVKEINYLLDGVARLRLPLSRADVVAALSKATRRHELEECLHRLLLDVALPPPPWLGNETVVPLRTMGAMRQTGRMFSNCLADSDYGFRALCGHVVLYVVNLRGLHFCCQLKRDRILRSWRLTEIKGPRNNKPTRSQLQAITRTFADAGFTYLPKSLLEFWYD